jgi:hypothetical protein
MSEPIDVTLVALRQRIAQARERQSMLEDGFRVTTSEKLLFELADEAEKVADYVGQPDPEKIKGWALEPLRAIAARSTGPNAPSPELAAALEEDEGHRFTFSMQAVVDRVHETAPDVSAYVEQTGGGCATIYAASHRGEGEPVLYQLPGEDWGRWPIMAGPGSFDWHGTDHVASLDEFFIGPDTELVPAQDGPPFPPPPGEYGATRGDDVDSLARAVIQAVRQWESGEIPHDDGVIVWPGR